VQITQACEFNCAYCCVDAGCAAPDEITFEEATRIAEATRRVLGRGAQFGVTGGEPLSVPWAADLAEHAVDLGLRLTLFTTAVPLVNDELAQRMAALTVRGADLRVGLPAPSSALCDDLAEGARFARAMQGICNVARFGGKLSVDLMLFPRHVETVVEFLPALRERLPAGTALTLNPLLNAGRERGDLSFDSRAELEDALDRIAIRAGVAIPATKRAPLLHRRDGCSCSLGEQVHVRSDRAVFPCTRMEEQVGDLASDGFAETLRRVRRTPHRASYLPLCGECVLATICGGGCRSENLRLGGDPDVPVCGPWRIRVLCELLAEDRVTAVEWPVAHLLTEARQRGIDAPEWTTVSELRPLISTL
jgi:radical SAM protein with 4Fe4S-binding SPASM domain